MHWSPVVYTLEWLECVCLCSLCRRRWGCGVQMYSDWTLSRLATHWFVQLTTSSRQDSSLASSKSLLPLSSTSFSPYRYCMCTCIHTYIRCGSVWMLLACLVWLHGTALFVNLQAWHTECYIFVMIHTVTVALRCSQLVEWVGLIYGISYI